MCPERGLRCCVSLPDAVQLHSGGVGAVQEGRLQIGERQLRHGEQPTAAGTRS